MNKSFPTKFYPAPGRAGYGFFYRTESNLGLKGLLNFVLDFVDLPFDNF
jgi:hypothetical protein